MVRGLYPDHFRCQRVSFELVILPDAETDISEAFRWYEARRKGLGLEFLHEIRMIFDGIEDNPLRYPVVYKDARRALPRRFPYKILDFVEKERIRVLGVVHVKRQPQTWQGRI